MIVVDTNILFSSLLNCNAYYYDILTDKSLQFLIPKFAFIELFKYKEKIIKYSKHNDDEILEILYNMMKNIQIYDENIISSNSYKKAWHLTKDIDEKDTVFVALCLETNSKLWTGDKKLINGLKNKGFDNFFHN
ncbi:hypothetical protein TI05_01275 [Achromatium sp. WMS3]|nr:hypothetical protein TI05_01275 [Achromatium sp. WMS3]